MIPDKPALRTTLRARRHGFAAGHAGSWPVPTPFLKRLEEGLIVSSYVPVGGEADPSPFIAAARDAGCRLALPHVVDRATPLRFLLVDSDAALESGPFGLHNPPADGHEAAPDIILTPLVGFDRRGNRVGQGAGHYDRAFADYPAAWRVGLAWSVQEVDMLPADPWDVPLHAVATEREWIVPA